MSSMDPLREASLSMEYVGEEDSVRRPVAWIEHLHIGCTALACFFALWGALHRHGALAPAMAAGFAFLCLAGLRTSWLLRGAIQEFYRQFHYKEKFALFLVHAVVLLIPWLVLGITDWAVLVGVLLVFVCWQAIDALFYGRIHFLTALICFVAAVAGDSGPGSFLTALWLLFTLLAFRFGHLVWRLERHGLGDRIDLGLLIRGSVAPAVVPALLAWSAYAIAANSMSRRALTFSPGVVERDGTDVFVSFSSIVMDAFFICLMLGVGLAALNWLDKKLRRRSKGEQIGLDEVEGATVHRRRTGEAISDLAVEEGGGARERILKAFAAFDAQLVKLGLGRGAPETADHWFSRIAAPNEPAPAPAAEPFDRACYSVDEIEDRTADDFVAGLDAWLKELASTGESEAAEEPPAT